MRLPPALVTRCSRECDWAILGKNQLLYSESDVSASRGSRSWSGHVWLHLVTSGHIWSPVAERKRKKQQQHNPENKGCEKGIVNTIFRCIRKSSVSYGIPKRFEFLLSRCFHRWAALVWCVLFFIALTTPFRVLDGL